MSQEVVMDTNMQHCPYTPTDADTGRIPAGATMVGRYHDDALPPAERALFAEHLAQCPACAEELRQLSAIRQALRAMPMPPASRQFVGDLQAQWEQVPQLTVARFVGRLTRIAAAVAIVAMGHLTYEMIAGRTPSPAPVAESRSAAPPSAWEQVAIAPDSTRRAGGYEQPTVGSASQFAEFVVHDLGVRSVGGAGGGRP
jgi:anti-sigma factor RsiW